MLEPPYKTQNENVILVSHDNSPEHLAGNATQFRLAVRGHTA